MKVEIQQLDDQKDHWATTRNDNELGSHRSNLRLNSSRRRGKQHNCVMACLPTFQVEYWYRVYHPNPIFIEFFSCGHNDALSPALNAYNPKRVGMKSYKGTKLSFL